jgi:signal transduction histidine kinase
MKKRIILGLAIFTSIFVLGGIYLIVTIEKATSTMNNLITLHQVEILREQLLNDARAVESYLSLRQTKFPGTLGAVIGSVVVMEDKANQCLGCHHTAVITGKLQNLKGLINAYKEALSRLLEIRTNTARAKQENNMAFEMGHELVTLLDEMTSLTKVRLEKRTQATLLKISDMKKLIFIFIVVGPIFAIGLAIIFTQGFTGPLTILLSATRKLKSGDLSFRLQDLPYEFGEMAIAFNEMSAALNEQMHKMQRAEQMTMVGEMAARLIHEIKNPLAGIKGAIQVFQDGADISEEERAILSQVIDDCQRVESLMKNLLNFAKPPKPQLLPININDVLDASFSPSLPYSFSSLNSPKDIMVVKHFDPLVPLIMADPMEMQQVFLNLLINAVQAMPAGGTLTVRTFNNVSTKEIQIEITDTGKGISDAIREKIFQPFFTTKSKGTGLGLAISRQFIEMHGGTISADNNPQGGLTFRIILPCTQVEYAPPLD